MKPILHRLNGWNGNFLRNSRVKTLISIFYLAKLGRMVKMHTPRARGPLPSEVRNEAPHLALPMGNFNDRPVHNSAEGLLAGKLRIGTVGFNFNGFFIKHPVRHDAPQLGWRIESLPRRIRQVRNPRIDMELSVALETLSSAPEGRQGILLITAGAPDADIQNARAARREAARRGIGVNVIEVSDESSPELSGLVTQPTLGFGRYHQIQNEEQFIDAMRGGLDALAPAWGMIGVNTGVLVIDCSKNMLRRLDGLTRLEMTTDTLQRYLRNPPIRPLKKRLNHAA